jgi:hypothetical protein
MKNPCQTPMGSCYEKSFLVEYIKVSGPKDPIGFKSFKDISNCALNKALQECIRDFMKKNPNLIEGDLTYGPLAQAHFEL